MSDLQGLRDLPTVVLRQRMNWIDKRCQELTVEIADRNYTIKALRENHTELELELIRREGPIHRTVGGTDERDR